MNGFLYTLTLEEPVLANSLGGDPNSANSLFYIPGGAVRGAAIQAYGPQNDAAETDFRRLFLSGETRFLNAYPLVNAKRALPAPLTWQAKRKPAPDEKKVVYNQVPAQPETKSVPFDFWFMDGATLHSVEEAWQINVHTQRDAERGRATSEAGAVYRYIAIPAGVKLQGVVLAQNAADAKKLEALLNDKSVLLGKARTAGYGHAKMETAPLPVNWRESGQTLTANRAFTLTLLSPALVRDENGQFSLDIAAALTARLGVTPKIEKVERRAAMIGGFNRTWGLPLPQATAIAAGSVFTITADVSAQKLIDLEATGIGERRAEGFGSVAVNLELPAEVDWKPEELNLDAPTAGKLSADDPLAKLMLTRLLRRDLDEQVLRCARAATEQYNGGIPNSQLSRWRVIVRDALGKKDDLVKVNGEMKKYDLPGRVKTFYAAESKKRSAAWSKMEQARIDFNGQRPRLTEWIESVLENPEVLQQSWEAKFNPERKLGSNSNPVDADLNAEYRLRLLDAVLAVMAKKSGGKNG